MNRRSRGGRAPSQTLRIFSATISVLTVLALLPLIGLGSAAAQSTATITVNSYAEDGTTPLPFARFTITGSDGATYGPLEATPPDGKVTFTVNVGADTTFTIVEDTPPACGEAPDPLQVGPLAAGEAIEVDFSTTFLNNCDLGSISAYRYLCPEGTDLGGDYATLSSTCLTTVDGATFLFREAADQGQEWTAETGDYGIPGRAPLVGLEPGDYTVEEQVDDSIYSVPQGEPTVYCLTFTGTPAESSSPESTEKVKTNDGQITLTIDDNRIACDFFTVPATEEEETPAPPDEQEPPQDEIAGAGTGTGQIEMHLAACPAGYGGDNLFNDCHGNPIEGVNITADGPGGYSETGTSVQQNDPGPGVVIFSNLAAGNYTLHQDIPGDNNAFRIYCSLADADDTVPVTETADLGFTINLTEGMSVVCDWYTIPTDQGGGAGTGSGRVEIHLAACPPGYSGGSYFNDCHGTPIEGVNVSADGPGGYSDTQSSVQQVDPGPGVVVFNNVPAGSVTFHQDIPGDNNSFFIYCSLADADDTVPHTETADLGFTLNMTDGLNVICDWYTIPDQQVEPPPAEPDNTIEIAKYICPVDFSAGSLGEYQAACATIMTDVTFTLTNTGTGEETRQRTGSDGKVEFGVGAGSYGATEDVPGEFSTPTVFCAGEGEDFVRFDNLGTGGLPFTETSGEHDFCYWYNVPEDLSGAGAPSSVTIHKSRCPDGYNGNNYFDTCHDNGLPGIGFNASGPDGYAKTGTTNNEGHLTFGNLDAGTYTFTEKNPTDFTLSVYAVYCSVEGGDTIDVDYVEGLGASIDVPEGVSVICDWYNVPEAPGPTGSITVHAFLCSGKEDNDYNWEQDCTNYGDGAGFDLLSAAGEKVVSGKTNVDGILLFYSLSDGGWGLKETTANWCHAEADRVDANGDVLVTNGGNTDVFIYNCGKKNIVTLPSTGAGPMSGTNNAGLWSLVGGLAGISVLAVVRRRARAA
jgi:hypothetical protein